MVALLMRLPESKREGLSPDGQAAWDHIAGTRGAVGGPFQVLINVPELARPVADVGTYLRFNGQLAGADRELAILAVAREIGSRYEWVGHEAIARKEGVRHEAIEAIRTLAPLDGLTEHERLIVELMRALHRDHRIPDGQYAAALQVFGQSKLVELVGLAGFYGLIGLTLVAFQVEPSGGERPF